MAPGELHCSAVRQSGLLGRLGYESLEPLRLRDSRSASDVPRSARGAVSVGASAVPLSTPSGLRPGGRALGKGVASALAAVRRRIFRAFFGKLVSRRARFIAYQRRRSLQPTGAETQAASRWARAYVRKKGVLARLVATALAGQVGASIGRHAAAGAGLTVDDPGPPVARPKDARPFGLPLGGGAQSLQAPGGPPGCPHGDQGRLASSPNLSD